jgi:hypothetical protein
MALTKQRFSELIKGFKYRELFNELGWNNDKSTQQITIGDRTYNLISVAEKCGLKILTCKIDELPNLETRRKIDIQTRKLFYHYILICVDNNDNQKWIVPVKKIDKRELVTTDYSSHQIPEFLYQKLSELSFSLEQEEKLTIVDVSKIVNNVFVSNSEKVTKQFFDKFKKEHTAFLNFIKGIDEKVDKEWYASLMLNRLMFCYFIQKKGFLDNNTKYLQDKLKACREKKGKDKFYSFYRDFLLVLFHEGLNEPTRKKEVQLEIGKIPYLNGGLFDVHQLEKEYKDIEIEDKAFEKIFDFFDEYEWHLDTRISSTGKDINPDVIGYIFEKYINDRADMGAYYTKEDITEYISKNTILPYLFEESERNYPAGFNENAKIWEDFRNSKDEYFYYALTKGIHEELPIEISKGIKDTSKRSGWNNKADDIYSLPNEIWKEVVERRKRYFNLREKVEKGEINNIKDFITNNLNIKKFIYNILENTEDPKLISTFYKSLTNITILDPTCGSGAFLFAAMNILEPLYELCIEKMQNFVEKSQKGKYKGFEEILKSVKAPEHPNLQYFIYKNIILHNLYGVDIMNEAVEIAKLRLFLKLAALVDVDHSKKNMGLEPLPDIDFNIRSGNTLVGFASLDDAIRVINEREKPGQIGFIYKDELDIVNTLTNTVDDYSRAYSSFKNAQLKDGLIDSKKSKYRLKEMKNNLDEILNEYLAYSYGIDKKKNKGKYDKWLESHKPFNWFAEYYEIIKNHEGFDIIIGNPPYVEYSSIKKIYTINNYESISSGNLYAFVIERAINIQKNNSYNGMIIPLSAYSTDRMAALQKIEFQNCKEIFISYYAERPSKLFDGAERNLAITIFKKQTNSLVDKIYTTYYYKWNASYREFLFDNLIYEESKIAILKGIIPKISTKEEKNIIGILRNVKKSVSSYLSNYKTNYVLYYRNSGGRYWKIISNFQPRFFLNGKKDISSRESYLYFNDETTLKIFVSILNSSLFYWYYVMHSDARTNNPSDLKDFPIDIDSFSTNTKLKLISTCETLMKDIEYYSTMQIAKYVTGSVKFQQFYPQKSKNIIDRIDRILAEHYGFNDEELDFIINYDIKYRMGKELETGEE